MKFPKLTQLDADQKVVYNGAPPTDSILVVGPPGTGKTVIAFHRAAFLHALSERQDDPSVAPRVIMFNNVLANYTSTRDGVAPGVAVSTMHAWAFDWWKRSIGGTLPTVPDNSFQFDWGEALKRFATAPASQQAKAHWGHLVIDEGQDFPKQMYAALKFISGMVSRTGRIAPQVSVFADENQRLQATGNSTLSEIAQALALPPDRQYLLQKNYRNSKQIAAFARHFYVGLPSGIPQPPTKVGRARPRVTLASSLEVVRRRIAAHASNNPGEDIGVICSSDPIRKKVFNSIFARLAKSHTAVQTYSYYQRAQHPATSLKFDVGGSVTVLNAHSAKGLEFDSVFLVDPFVDGGAATSEHAKMQIYVMASRAREYLELLVLNQPRDLAGWLPPRDLYDAESE